MFSRDHYELFQKLIHCNYPLYFWEYDCRMKLLDSSCPHKNEIDRLFELNQTKQYLRNYCRTLSLPVNFTDELELLWSAVFSLDTDGKVDRILLMGPAFLNDNSFQKFQKKLDSHTLSVPVRRQMHDFFESLPVIPSPLLYQHLLMFHRCIREETLTFRQIIHRTLLPVSPERKTKKEMSPQKVRNVSRNAAPGSVDGFKFLKNYIYQSNDELQVHPHTGIYRFEKELVMMIRQGSLAALDALDQGALISGGVNANLSDSLQQARYSCVMLITICSRAAIDGGLSPDIAYSLCDLYTRAVDGCTSVNDIKNLGDTLLYDFVSRVHECRKNPGVSAPIASCLDYISIHIREQISMESLATLTGYTVYYLTAKFKKEMGISPKSYIQKEKIAYAKRMLSSGEDSITEISEALHFCSQSYFSKIFMKETQMSPSDYRQKSRR